jgi:hypothetical protein
MSDTTRQVFQVHPHDRSGTWEANDGRYRNYAHEMLTELERLCEDVQLNWLQEIGPALKDKRLHPEQWGRVRMRDRTSDTVRIYAAMAVEGFLNFYGVLRIGQDLYDDHFERLGIVPKLRKLLLVCDGLNIPKNDPLCLDLDCLAQSRNALVHPKTKEILGNPSAHQRSFTKIPEKARESVAAMENFFTGFINVVPAAKPYLERSVE